MVIISIEKNITCQLVAKTTKMCNYKQHEMPYV